MKAVAFAILIATLKYYVDLWGFSVIPMNSLVTSLLGGVFFTIGILFAGAIADYKEAEKIPGELAVAIKTMHKDSRIIPVAKKDRGLILGLQAHVVGLLGIINSNFRRNVWKLKEINRGIDDITEDLRLLGEKGVAAGFLTKFRSELSAIDRFSHRIDTITETTFVPAAYSLAEIAISSVLLILLFVNLDIAHGAIIIIGIVSTVLISLMFLIKDVDSPFEVNEKSYADVDLSVLFNLEEYLKSITPGTNESKTGN